MSSDYAPALWMPANGHFFGGHDQRRAWIVLHGTAGFHTAREVAAFFQSGPHSTHYVVDRDGTVVQCVAEEDSAWANAPTQSGCDAWWHTFANPNFVTLSIEHVKPSPDNSEHLTQAQMAASFALIKHLCDKWHIVPQQADEHGGITGHFSIDPVDRKSCPGPYPWDELFAYLQGHPVDFGTPTHDTHNLPGGHPVFGKWSDDGTTLMAPNGITVVKGFRQHILAAHGWDATNVPLAAEASDSQHSVQLFTQYELNWTPERNVYFGPAGQELMDARAQVTNLTAQVAILQQQSAAKDTQITTLQQQATDQSNQIATLQQQSAAKDAQITALQQQIRDLSKQSTSSTTDATKKPAQGFRLFQRTQG